MPDVAWPTTDIEIEPGTWSIGLGGTGLGTTGWRAFAVDTTGTNLGELEVESFAPIVEEAGKPATTSLTFKSSSTSLALIPGWESEVQIYCDDRLEFWGVPMPWSWDSESAIVVVSLADVSIWASRRACLTAATNPERITNGGFEDGFTRWNVTGAVIDTGTVHGGTKSAKLTDQAHRVTQRFTVQGPCKLHVTGWFYGSTSGWVDAGRAGIEIEAAPRFFGQSDKNLQALARVTAATDSWEYVQAALDVLPGSWDVTVRARGANGDLYVDDVSAVVYGQVTRIAPLDFLGGDITQMDTGLFARSLLLATLADLDIGVVSGDSGVSWSDQADAWSDKYVAEALEALRRLETPSDWELVVTPTTRLIRMWHPLAGRSQHHAGLTLSNANAQKGTGGIDSTRATRLIVIGENGEWVIVTDPDNDPDGHPVDEIVAAPAGTAVTDLRGFGLSHMRSTRARNTRLTVTGITKSVMDPVKVTDTLNVSAQLAGPAGAGPYQVVRKITHPDGQVVDVDLASALS